MGHIRGERRDEIREQVFNVIDTAHQAEPPGYYDLVWICAKLGISSERYTHLAINELIASGRVIARLGPANHKNAGWPAKRVFVPVSRGTHILPKMKDRHM